MEWNLCSEKFGERDSFFSIQPSQESMGHSSLHPEKVRILKAFKQDHLIAHFEGLSDLEKNRFETDLGFVEIDVLDLVSKVIISQNYHNIYKKMEYQHSPQPRQPSRIIDLDKTNIRERALFHERGYRAISEGKVAVVIDASDPSKDYARQERGSSMLDSSKDSPNINRLTNILNKLREIGDQAIKLYGKNFEGIREPIMPILCVSEAEIDIVEKYLVDNNYLEYKGFMCLSIVK